MGTLTVDMNGYSEMKVDLVAVDPSGFILDIGDSPCVNGGGGDCGFNFNDAELDVQSDPNGQVTLRLYSSDLIPRTNGTEVLATIPEFFKAQGTSERTLYVKDKSVCTDGGSCWEHDALLRINAEDPESHVPDSLWYLGLNRVVWEPTSNGTARVGSGLRSVTLTLK
jgi:hypothetical protein